MVTTSGVLRDARTGAPIPSSCVAYRTAAATQANYSNVNQDGTFSFQTDDVDGPVSIAFYVVANFNCSGPVLSTTYLPAWYQNQPFTGTDPSTATPPDGATAVAPGSTNIVACLAPDQLPTRCTTPTTTFSGQVVTLGSRPINQACIVVISPGGNATGPGITDTNGRWTLTGLPNNTPLVVGVIPPYATGGPPCQFDGPPPAPAPGQLQPEFYRNIWVDLTPDPNNPLFQDAYTWAIEHGATTITNSSTGLDVCLTTDPGSVVPRPACTSSTPSPTPTTSSPEPTITETSDPDGSDSDGSPANESNLAATGGPSAWLLALAAGLIALGATAVHSSLTRRH